VIRQKHLSPVICGHSQYVHSFTDFLYVINVTHNFNDANFNKCQKDIQDIKNWLRADFDCSISFFLSLKSIYLLGIYKIIIDSIYKVSIKVFTLYILKMVYLKFLNWRVSLETPLWRLPTKKFQINCFRNIESGDFNRHLINTLYIESIMILYASSDVNKSTKGTLEGTTSQSPKKVVLRNRMRVSQFFIHGKNGFAERSKF